MPDDDDDEKTPVASPQARRESDRHLPRAEACPGCLGAVQVDPRVEPCEICEGQRFTNNPITISAWRIRAILHSK